MASALREAESLRLDTVQVFTKNQQQWRVPPLADAARDEWLGELRRLGWGRTGDDPGRTVAHASYLINLASPDDALWEKSVALMREEIDRCERLDIGHLVHHPGSTTGGPAAEGIARIAEAYRRLLGPEAASAGGQGAAGRVVLCLENTVGGGSVLGRPFEELAAIREAILGLRVPPERVGYCFDTCHAHAGGYDLSSAARARAALDELAKVVGLDLVRVVHVNDSKAGAGSRLDRHEHVGKGTIGLEGLAEVVNREGLWGRPMILETPKGKTEAGTPLDALNLRRLRSMRGGREPSGRRDRTSRAHAATEAREGPKEAKRAVRRSR